MYDFMMVLWYCLFYSCCFCVFVCLFIALCAFHISIDRIGAILCVYFVIQRVDERLLLLLLLLLFAVFGFVDLSRGLTIKPIDHDYQKLIYSHVINIIKLSPSAMYT